MAPSALPEGWQYKTATFNQDLTITTNGVANIVLDNLANMCQGCVDGVNNFRSLGLKPSRPETRCSEGLPSTLTK